MTVYSNYFASKSMAIDAAHELHVTNKISYVIKCVRYGKENTLREYVIVPTNDYPFPLRFPNIVYLIKMDGTKQEFFK